MKTLIASLAIAGLLTVTAVGSFMLGTKTNRTESAAGVASVQAVIGFNHLLRYRVLEADLSKGCASEALEKVRISIDQETRLLSSYYSEHDSPSVSEYISKRDPTLLTQLKGYKSKYGESWSEPQCPK